MHELKNESKVLKRLRRLQEVWVNIAATNIQRIVRGRQGRRLASRKKIENSWTMENLNRKLGQLEQEVNMVVLLEWLK